MRPNEMHNIAHQGCHDCSPKAWHDVPKVTGDYDLDATILHRKNRDMPARLRQHLVQPKTSSYRHRTMGSGNHGSHGDD